LAAGVAGGDGVRVAWLTHHLPRPDDAQDNPAHLPGRFAGGAEMTDAELLELVPAGVEVDLLGADEWERALDADHIIITGTDFLEDEACHVLAGRQPTVFVHHKQTRRPGVAALLNGCRVLILHTPAHEAVERSWTAPRRVEHVLSPLRTSDCDTGPKGDHAVWAQRWHPLKGPLAAKYWSAKQGIPLRMLTNVPRSDVLEAMSAARWWVHLPLGFESESRASIEAVLSGCVPVVNSNVGVSSVEGWQDPGRLRDMVDQAGHRFWQVAV
jgi:hypothetical protein